MKTIFFTLIVITSISFTSCKEKADIKVTVFDPGMNQPIINAEVKIAEFEYKQHKPLFSASYYRWDLTEILQTETTDNNGVAIFQKLKMKENSDFKYEVICNKNSQMDTDLQASIAKKKGSQNISMTASTSGNIGFWCHNLFDQYIIDDYLEIRSKGKIIEHITKDNMNSGYNGIYFLGSLNLPTGENEILVIKTKLGIKTSSRMTFNIKHLENDSLIIKW